MIIEQEAGMWSRERLVILVPVALLLLGNLASAFRVFNKKAKANTIGEVPTPRSGKYVGSKTSQKFLI